MTHWVDSLSSGLESVGDAVSTLGRRTEAWRIETELRAAFELERAILDRSLHEARKLKDPAYRNAHEQARQLIARAGVQEDVTAPPVASQVPRASDAGLQRFAEDVRRRVQSERGAYLSGIRSQLQRDSELSTRFQALMRERHDPYYLKLVTE